MAALLVVAFARRVDGEIQFTFSKPDLLSTDAPHPSGFPAEPQVTTDGTGNWVAVWASDNLKGVDREDFDILGARSTDNGATWGAAATLNKNADTDSGTDWGPKVTTDGHGNWVAVWASNDTLGGTLGVDYHVLVARSVDNGANWTVPAVLHSSMVGDSASDLRPQVCTDRQGHWAAVWQSAPLNGTGDADILVARSMDNGSTWTAPTPLNANAASDTANDYVPRLV